MTILNTISLLATAEPATDAAPSGGTLLAGIMLIGLVLIILIIGLLVWTLARRSGASARIRNQKARRTRLSRRNAWEEAGRRASPDNDGPDPT